MGNSGYCYTQLIFRSQKLLQPCVKSTCAAQTAHRLKRKMLSAKPGSECCRQILQSFVEDKTYRNRLSLIVTAPCFFDSNMHRICPVSSIVAGDISFFLVRIICLDEFSVFHQLSLVKTFHHWSAIPTSIGRIAGFRYETVVFLVEALMEQVAAAEMAVTQPSPWDMGRKQPWYTMVTLWLWLTVRHGKSPFFIGKPSINGPFSMAMLVITRGYINTSN